jgi:hypothetical protein
MRLIRVIYASTKIDTLKKEDIQNILLASRKNNDRSQITGVLCFSHNHFLQCLEGDRMFVNELYNRIAGDKRHVDPFIIDYTEISERSFSSWAMGFVPDTEISRELILKYSPTGRFDPSEMSAASALGFLKAVTQRIE